MSHQAEGLSNSGLAFSVRRCTCSCSKVSATTVLQGLCKLGTMTEALQAQEWTILCCENSGLLARRAPPQRAGLVQLWPACTMLSQKSCARSTCTIQINAYQTLTCLQGRGGHSPALASILKGLLPQAGPLLTCPACAALAQCACLHSLPLHPFRLPAGALC